MSKFYVRSGSVRWTIGDCEDSHMAARLFVWAFRSRANELATEIVVAERGWRSQWARDATCFRVDEILRERLAELTLRYRELTGEEP